MESPRGWRRLRYLSFKNATIAVCLLNLAAAAVLLQSFFSSYHRFRSVPSHRFQSDHLKYVMESLELRRALEPVELIKRVREIEQEVFADEPESEMQKLPKQTTAVDLSNRLKDLRSTNDANSLKALEEWRKRKMERARQREIEKNGAI
ncbi:uncharacterized protein LOC120275757 [Dioscorea cayenensis subsp. rotundata]|uniref:Uncharacterized protein LOC120275757 n=1 Tax=Dioscorea cayennensis subsp. rotundata TaxID=55577 RepID=A0AB40CEM5_DIOCR|nr:uncharacterized protein LOC120275757 [Dioscorea cayenensis subsp. rotundata]